MFIPDLFGIVCSAWLCPDVPPAEPEFWASEEIANTTIAKNANTALRMTHSHVPTIDYRSPLSFVNLCVLRGKALNFINHKGHEYPQGNAIQERAKAGL
jgi:hypothetical protein